MYGNKWTTLGPSPQLVGKTGLRENKGSAAIVFDTFMDPTLSADSAVVFTSGSGSVRRWFGLSATDTHKFGISCDFYGAIPYMKSCADQCKNEKIGTGTTRKLTGDRVTYGSDKAW